MEATTVRKSVFLLGRNSKSHGNLSNMFLSFIYLGKWGDVQPEHVNQVDWIRESAQHIACCIGEHFPGWADESHGRELLFAYPCCCVAAHLRESSFPLLQRYVT